MKELISVLGSYQEFLDQVTSLIESNGIVLNSLDYDQITFLVRDREQLDTLMQKMLDFGVMLFRDTDSHSESLWFKLDKPITYQGNIISIVELSWKREGREEGLRHIGFVIDTDLRTFMDRYDAIDFDITGLEFFSNPFVAISSGTLKARFYEIKVEDLIAYEKEIDRSTSIKVE